MCMRQYSLKRKRKTSGMAYKIVRHTGIWIVGAFPKYFENRSALIVALIRISRRSGRRGRTSRNIINRKSSFMPLSWISSTSKWVIPVKYGSCTCIQEVRRKLIFEVKQIMLINCLKHFLSWLKLLSLHKMS